MLAAILLASISFSCTRPEESIGLGIQPEEDLLSVSQMDTVTMVAYTVTEDSLRTDELSHTLLGNYNDPVFGRTKASYYAQIRLSSTSVDFGNTNNIYVDSLVLAMKLEGSHYGSSKPQEFEVYEIDEDLYLDSSYYSNQTLSIKSQNLVLDGHSVVKPNVIDTVSISGNALAPQLRVQLDTTFARDVFLSQSGTANLDDNDAFTEYFKGIYVRSNTLDGGVLSIDMFDPQTSVIMYYRDLNGEEADTTSFVFSINNLSPHYYHLDQEKTDNLLPLQTQDSIPADPHTYTQGGAGVITRIDFPFIEDLDGAEGFVINRAEMIIPVKDPSLNRPYRPTQLLLRRPLDESTALIPDDVSVDFQTGGFYDEEVAGYRFDISRFIQLTATGTIEDNSLFVLVDDRFALANGTVLPGVRRAILNGPSVSADDPSKNMRLIVTYTY
ncbi:MAG: DUF4270 domain-containing protein [Flavobacteriales bacterium]|nr:DUF4270 domain-containing protein [Flavobacteriales bacterium]